MANIKPTMSVNKGVGFEFKPFSEKQKKLLTWWQDSSPHKDKFMLISCGAVRSGKSLVMTLSFLLFSMTKFNHMNFAITSKSVGSARRNIIPSFKQMCESLGYTVVDRRSENFLIISNGEIQNYYFVFGGNIFAASAQKCA